MPDVKHQLSELDRLEPPELWDQIERRTPRPDLPEASSGMHKAGVIVLALALAAGGFALVVRAFGGDGSTVAQTSVAPVSSDRSPSLETVSETRVLPAAWHLVVAYDSVWVTGAGGVTRVDSSTGQVIDQIEIPHVDESDIAAGAGHVWVTAGAAIVGIDVATNHADRRFEIETGIRRIAFANDRLYVGHSAEGNGTLDEIDPTTGAFGRDVLTGGPGLGESAILPTARAIWVGYSSPESSGSTSGLVRVSDDLSRADPVPGVERVFSLAEADGHIWAVGTEVLYEVAADGTLVNSFRISRAGAVASDGEHLWLLRSTGSTSDWIYLPDPNVPARVVQVDTTTGALVGDGIALTHFVPASIAVGDGRVWVSFYDDGILTGLAIGP